MHPETIPDQAAERSFAIITDDGELYVLPWRPRPPKAPPAANVIELTREGVFPDRELIVGFQGAALGSTAYAAVVEWAAATGHARLWMPGTLIDLSDRLLPAGGHVTCKLCGAQHHDEGMRFMALVASHGTFPTHCPVCTGMLAQWQPLDSPPFGDTLA